MIKYDNHAKIQRSPTINTHIYIYIYSVCIYGVTVLTHIIHTKQFRKQT